METVLTWLRTNKVKDPTPAEIRERAKKIRATESFKKRNKPKREHWTPPTINILSHIVDHREWDDDD